MEIVLNCPELGVPLQKAIVVHAGDVPVGPKLNQRVHWPSSLRSRSLGTRDKPSLHGSTEFFCLGDHFVMSHSCLHLKICEGCGRLWLRNHTVSDVYCHQCTVHFSDFPAPRSRRPKGRPSRERHSPVMQLIEGGVR
jgi:hypothetical protein